MGRSSQSPGQAKPASGKRRPGYKSPRSPSLKRPKSPKAMPFSTRHTSPRRFPLRSSERWLPGVSPRLAGATPGKRPTHTSLPTQHPSIIPSLRSRHNSSSSGFCLSPPGAAGGRAPCAAYPCPAHCASIDRCESAPCAVHPCPALARPLAVRARPCAASTSHRVPTRKPTRKPTRRRPLPRLPQNILSNTKNTLDTATVRPYINLTHGRPPLHSRLQPRR